MNRAYDKNNNLVWAKDLDETSKSTKYKCYNSKCNGEFLFRSGKSNYKTSCFYYHPQQHDKNGVLLNPHISNCWCLSSNDSSMYNPDTFDLNNFINNLNTAAPNSIPPPKSGDNPKPTPTDTTIDTQTEKPKININTLKQLHNFCKGNDPESNIGNIQIKDLYVYNESLEYYRSIQNTSTREHLFLLEKTIYTNTSIRAKCYGYNKRFLIFDVTFADEKMCKQAISSFYKNASGVKFASPKTEFLVLAKPGECAPIPNSDYVIQTLYISNLKYIHVL